MATQQQIRDTAAENLGIVGEGETLPSYETADLDTAYLEVYAILQRDDLAAWSLVDDVPNEFSGAVSMLVAGQRVTKYQVPPERYARIVSEGWGQNNDGQAIKTIRRLQAPTKVSVTRMEDF